VAAIIRIHSKDPMGQDNLYILLDMEWAWACAVAGSNSIIHQPPLLSLSFLILDLFELLAATTKNK
jgi:hypothetical protein